MAILSTEPENRKPFFAPRGLLWGCVLLIFAVGLAVRLYDLTDLPLDFHPTRQLHSALMARGMYYQNLTSVPDWQRELAVQQWKAEGLIEPPIMENLVALTYRLAGQEVLWVARLYSILFWMLGGVALFLLARELAGVDGAVAGLLYFLLLPYGAIASRSFQPDPLLVSAIIFGWWAAVRWYKTPTWKWTLIAGVLCGLAIFIKLVAVFFIGFPLIGLVLGGIGLRRALRDLQVWALGILTLLPYAGFHVYGMYVTHQLESQFSLRFFPQLWIDPTFYLRWNGEISHVIGFEWLIVALLGTFTVRSRPLRAMLVAAWLGYLAYGFTLSYHISTHDYYQLPLIPIAALGIAAAAETAFRALRGPVKLLYPIVIGVLLFGLVVKGWDTRVTLKRDDYRGEAAYWKQIGETVGPGSSVIGLTQDYGYRLAYWGWVQSTNWLTSGDFNLRALAGQEYDMKQQFDEQTSGKDFFLVTMLEELDHQPKLKSLLNNNYPVLKEGGDFIIYDLRNPLQAAQTP